MKIYSLLLVCLTLGVFYGLAVHEQNIRNNNQKKHHVSSSTSIEKNLDASLLHISPAEDEFANHVTGKEHIYLNTGISYMEEQNNSHEVIKLTQCIAENSKEDILQNLGS